jgi:hypothetical protein
MGLNNFKRDTNVLVNVHKNTRRKRQILTKDIAFDAKASCLLSLNQIY